MNHKFLEALALGASRTLASDIGKPEIVVISYISEAVEVITPCRDT